MNGARIFLVVIGLAGLFILAASVKMAGVRLELLADGVRTEGVVVRLERAGSGSGSSGPAYFPVVRFRAASGETFVFRSRTGTNPPSFEPGATVTVIHHSDDPGIAEIEDFWSLWFMPVVFGPIGLLVSGLGFGLLVWQVREARLMAWLQAHGRPVTAEVTAVEPATPEALLRRARWNITAAWQDPASQQVHVFERCDVPLDAEALPGHATIPVRIDPDDPKRYWMDVSGLVCG